MDSLRNKLKKAETMDLTLDNLEQEDRSNRLVANLQDFKQT
jgi:hypothetical protein